MNRTLFKRMALIGILMVSSCKKEKPIISYNDSDMLVCGNVDSNYELYELSDTYFNDSSLLSFRLNIIYFTNGDTTLDSLQLVSTIADVNKFFNNNGANINFKLQNITFITTIPENDPKILPFIKDVERVKNSVTPIETLRKSYIMKYFKYWNTLYGNPDCINMYVYGNQTTDCNIAGEAGGMGANFFAVRSEVCYPKYNTIEHEVAHCLNLLHIQAKDETNGFSNYTGDNICDTPSSPSLLGLVGDDCELKSNWEDLSKIYSYTNEGNDYCILNRLSRVQYEVIIHNIMGYSSPSCRQNFTEQQIRRMRKSIENSEDLRRCVIGLDRNNLEFLNEIQ